MEDDIRGQLENMHRVLKTLVQEPAVQKSDIEPQLAGIMNKFAVHVGIPEEILCKGLWKQTWYLWTRAAYLRLRFNKKQINQVEFGHGLQQIVVPQYAQPINQNNWVDYTRRKTSVRKKCRGKRRPRRTKGLERNGNVRKRRGEYRFS